jgi:hypothetical protein
VIRVRPRRESSLEVSGPNGPEQHEALTVRPGTEDRGQARDLLETEAGMQPHGGRVVVVREVVHRVGSRPDPVDPRTREGESDPAATVVGVHAHATQVVTGGGPRVGFRLKMSLGCCDDHVINDGHRDEAAVTVLRDRRIPFSPSARLVHRVDRREINWHRPPDDHADERTRAQRRAES